MHCSIITNNSDYIDLRNNVLNIAHQHNLSICVDNFLSFKDYLDRGDISNEFCIFIDSDSITESYLDIINTLRDNNFLNFVIFYFSQPVIIPLNCNFYNVHFFQKSVLISSISNFVQSCIACHHKIIDSQVYTFKCDNEIHRIPFNDILYFSSSDHYVNIFTVSDEHYLHYTTLKNLELSLPNNLLRIHRSYIVNTQHITHVFSDTVQLTSNLCIPFSKSYVNDFSFLKQKATL